jgi:hypothetical protein
MRQGSCEGISGRQLFLILVVLLSIAVYFTGVVVKRRLTDG